MIAQMEKTTAGHISEMHWNNTTLIQVVPPTKRLAVWRVKNPVDIHPDYASHALLFAQTIGTAREKLSEALPATKESLVEAIILGENEMEKIRLSLKYPEGVVGFPYDGKYIYNHTGQLATTEGGFDNLTIEHKRGSVHELTHIIPGMENLPYWMGEGFCEAVPRFLLGYQTILDTSYLENAFLSEIVAPQDMEALSNQPNPTFFSIAKKPISQSKGYMSALAYMLGLASHMGHGDIRQGLVSFYDVVKNSISPEQLRKQIDQISFIPDSRDRYSMMNKIQKKGMKILTKQ